MSIGSSSTASSSKSPVNDTTALRDSLKAHNESFNQLLRHIPAQYYLRNDDDQPRTPSVPLTKAQKKAAKKKSQDVAVKAAKSEALRKAKLARYDPDEPKTIPEIQKAQLEAAAAAAAKGKARASASDSEDAEWEDASDAEHEAQDDDEEDSANDSDFADSDDGQDDDGELSGLPLLGKRDPDAPAPTITELRLKLQKRIEDIQAHKRGPNGVASSSAGAAEEDETPKSKEELLEQRRAQRGLVRDNRRRKRKAERREEKKDGTDKKEKLPSNGRKGGGKANAPPKEERKFDRDGEDEDERPRKKSKAAEAEPTKAVVVAPSPAPKAAKIVAKATPAPAADFSFSTLDFSTTALMNAKAGLIGKAAASQKKAHRHALPKDPNAALEVLAARKERLDKMEPEQREKREEKDRWEKVELKAGGEKIRDDEKRLKKMAKRQEKVKAKSSKAWSERKQTVSNTINAKVEKRNNNLAARVKQAKDKKAGIKTKTKSAVKTTSKSFSTRNKSTGGRPGFEGASKRKK